MIHKVLVSLFLVLLSLLGVASPCFSYPDTSPEPRVFPVGTPFSPTDLYERFVYDITGDIIGSGGRFNFSIDREGWIVLQHRRKPAFRL
mgnify:CR=1 FL=1